VKTSIRARKSVVHMDPNRGCLVSFADVNRGDVMPTTTLIQLVAWINRQRDIPNANRASSLGSSRIVQAARMAFTLTGSGTLENEGSNPRVFPSAQKLHVSQRSSGTASASPKCIARTFARPGRHQPRRPHDEIFHLHSEELTKLITSCSFLTASSSLSTIDW
jgi:hypothetical protein